MRKSLLVLTVAVTAFALSALTGTAAASVTIGSLAPEEGVGGCSLCTFVQVATDPAGPSYVVPFDGVITSFSANAGTIVTSDSWISFHVMHHVFSDSYAIDKTTGQVPIPATAAATTFRYPTSVPVTKNQILGLTINSGAPNGNTTPFAYTSSTSDLIGGFPLTPNVGEAANLNGAPSQVRRLNVQAVIEPDADKDGYGDETQDCYANDPKSHIAICPDTLAPVVTKLSTKRAKFAVNKKGKLIAAKTSKGTTFSFGSSEAATVAYTVYKVSKTKKLKKVHAFAGPATVGLNKLAYSGRYRDAKRKKKALAPGSYRLQVVETDAAGNKSAASSVSFKVVS